MLQYGRLAERTRDAKSDAVTMDAKSDSLAAVTKDKLWADRRGSRMP